MVNHSNTPNIENHHWLAKLQLAVILGFIFISFCLIVMKLGLVNGFLTPAIGDDSSLLSWLPSMSFISNAITTIFLYGFFVNGLLFLVVVGSGPHSTPSNDRQDRHFMRAIALTSCLWNGIVLWHVCGFQVISNPTQVLQMTSALHIYPSAEMLNLTLLHIAYGILWISLVFPLYDAKARGVLHFYSDIFNFIIVAYGCYGLFLVSSFLVGTTTAQTLQGQSWLASFNWSARYFFDVALFFILAGGVYLLTYLKNPTIEFEGLAFAHWFALVLTFGLVYVASPEVQLNLAIPAPLDLILALALGLTWCSILFYSYYASKQLLSCQHNHLMSKITVIIASTLMALELARIMLDVIPHDLVTPLPAWMLMSNNLFYLSACLFTSFLAGQWLLGKSNTKENWASYLEDLRLLIMLCGAGFCLGAGLLSVYYQHKVIGNSAVLDVKFTDINHSLQPLLYAYVAGVCLLTVGLVLQLLPLIMRCFLRETQALSQTPPIANTNGVSQDYEQPAANIKSLSLGRRAQIALEAAQDDHKTDSTAQDQPQAPSPTHEGPNHG